MWAAFGFVPGAEEACLRLCDLSIDTTNPDTRTVDADMLQPVPPSHLQRVGRR